VTLRSLAAKLSLGVVLLVLVSVGLMAGLAVWRSAEALRERALATNQTVALGVSHAVEQYVADARAIMREAAERPKLRQEVTSGNWPEARTVLENIALHFRQFDAVFVQDAQGIIRAQVPHAETVGEDFSSQDFFRKAIQTRRPYLSGVSVSKTVPRPVVAIAVPAFHNDGRVAGVLVGALSLQTMSHLVSVASADDGRAIYLVDSQGQVIADSRAAVESLRDMRAEPVVQAVLSGRAGTMVFSEPGRGEEMLGAYVPIRPFGWGVVVIRPTAAAQAPAARLRTVLIWIALACTAGVIGVGVGLARRLTRPLLRLAEASKRIAAGDLSTRVTVSGRDEVASLARAFNQMAEAVAQSHQALARRSAEVETMNRQLIQEVAERQQAEAATRYQAERLAILHEIDRAILAVHSPALIAETALRQLRRLVRGPRATLALYDFPAGEATWLAVDVEGHTQLLPGARFSLELMGDLAALRRGVIQIIEVHSLSHLPEGRDAAAEGIRSYAVVPLMAQGELIGSLNLGAPAPGGPSAEGLVVAREIADQLALALQQGRLHEDLTRSRDALKAVVDSAPVPIYAFDNNGAVTMWNPAAERLFGWTEAEVIGRPLPTVPPDKQVEFRALFERTRRGEALTAVEVRRQRKDGSPLELLVSTAPLRGADGTVQGFVNLSLDMTERKRAAERAEGLARVSRELVRILDAGHVEELIVSSALSLLRVRSAALYTRDGSSGPLVCTASGGPTDRDRWLGGTLLPGEGVAGRAAVEERPVWSPDFLADPRVQVPDWLAERANDEGYRAVLAVPLKMQDQVTGVLSVADVAGRAFTEEEVLLLSAFADQAAIAVHNAWVYAQTERARREATELAEVARDLTETLEVLDVGERIVERVLPLFNVRLAIVRVLEPDGALRAVAASGPARVPFGPGHVLPPGVGMMSQVVTEGRPMWTTDVRTDSRIARSTDSDYTERLLESGTEAALVVPLRAKGRIIGVLGISDAAGRVFSPREIALLQAFADQAAVALENARLFAEQRRAEEALRDARDRLDAIIDASPLAIIALDEHGLVKTWNRAATNLFGWSPEEMLDRPLPTIPEDRRDEYEALKAGYRVGQSVTELETKRRRKDGSLVDVVLSVAPIADTEGRPVGSIGVMADITQRKQLHEQLVQAQKMEAVGLLAGGIAHDFNNLLTVIGGRSALLVQRGGLSEATTRDAELISKTAERAAALTRQLLAFSRKQVLEPKPVDLNVLVGGVAPMLRRLIGEHIELVIVPGSGLGHVMADPGYVEQVVMNLIVNARDAMPDGGMVKIETASRDVQDVTHHAQGQVPPGRYVTLSVRDAGCGMDPLTLARIFEPFFTTKEPGKGTGLGLSTVHGIVHQSRGHIGVDSAVGRGTTFTIYLPQITEAVATVETPSGSRQEMMRGTETVLLVEDDEEVRALASEILKTCGYTVLDTGDPLEGLTIGDQRKGSIDLLLTDMVMPAMRGSELAQRLNATCPGLRVLYMSGYTDEMIATAGADEPARAFLHKPFSPHELATRVREVLAHP
jgi:PAS domain S-box-containing protein